MHLSSQIKKYTKYIANNINTNSSSENQNSCSFTNTMNYNLSSIICVNTYYFGNLISNNFTFCISNDKNILSLGNSDYCSHGHEDNKIFPIKQIQGLSNIQMISCGDFHSVCLTYNGDVFSFGKNHYGQLGIGSYLYFTNVYIPQKIDIPPCKQISCGNNFTICLSEDNKLYSFGENEYGQLGLGNYKNYSSPQLILDFNNIEYIVCGRFHSICKTYNNEIYSWGSNMFAQLGQGNYYNDCNKPIQCLNWPDNIISIKCGYYHTLLLTSQGQIYSFGDNNFGQLGVDRTVETVTLLTIIEDIPKIQRIECGNNHSMCIDINNNIWMFGDNTNGQLGLGDTKKKYKPILHPTLSNIIDISSGGNHTFVKTMDNKIYAFGNNESSQLGIQTSEFSHLTPIQVFINNEDVWCSTIGKSKQKSARK